MCSVVIAEQVVFHNLTNFLDHILYKQCSVKGSIISYSTSVTYDFEYAHQIILHKNLSEKLYLKLIWKALNVQITKYQYVHNIFIPNYDSTEMEFTGIFDGCILCAFENVCTILYSIQLVFKIYSIYK